MKKYLLIFFAALYCANFAVFAQSDPNLIRIFDGVVFYDGYRMENNPDKDLNDGVLRHSCSLYAKQLTDEVLDALGDKLDLNVSVQACCDNYDRIGNINIALVEKGAESYVPEETPRIEIGRFITPFMDMNVEPNKVPYSYKMDYLSALLRDNDIRADYDLWLEFELFGIPYAANTQVRGCKDRSDVFAGTLEFSTTEPAEATEGNILIPIVIKKPEYIGNNLNNYNENATDEIGKTVKTYTFEVPEDINDANVVLITSNHGANANGEEYNRRWHFIYFDDELVLNYRPGRESCEPFRKYNTQANSIYGYSKRSDEVWQSFSNWCPGDVIDNRIISLGKVEKGEHKIRIEVPLAEFSDQQGDIPVSMYFHGNVNAAEEAGIFEIYEEKEKPVSFSTDNGVVKISCPDEVWQIEVYSTAGERIHTQKDKSPIDLRGRTGIYIVCAELTNGKVFSGKVCL